MRVLTDQEVLDILVGCTMLATGGGGSMQESLGILKEDFENGNKVSLITLDELADDVMVATPYGCGAPEGDDSAGVMPEEYAGLPQLECLPSLLGFKKLEEFLGKKFSGVCSTELGAANLAEAIHIAMQLDLPLVDGDPVGRCVPELQHSTYYLSGVKINPMAVVTQFGDAIILDDVVDDFRAESIVRAISAASNDMVGVVDHPITGKVAKETLIPNAISHVMSIGKYIRECQEAGMDVATNVAQQFGGKVLFRGVITEIPWECVGGFNVGDIHLDGRKEYEGHNYRIGFKNENMVGYYDGVKNITIPDMICMLDKDGTPLTTPNYKVGTEMTLVAMPAPDVWKTEKGLECFGPSYFGLKEPYVPFSID